MGNLDDRLGRLVHLLVRQYLGSRYVGVGFDGDDVGHLLLCIVVGIWILIGETGTRKNVSFDQAVNAPESRP
jgi:hypothetical protein